MDDNVTYRPEEGVVIVQLPTSEWGAVPVPEKMHDSLTYGEIVVMNDKDKDKQYLNGCTIYFRKYKDDARFGPNNRLAFIEIKDILGSSYATDDANN